ncbi:MAG: hypothetical protein IJ584_01160 [Bacteroidales bacterium]|jgi:hypothetical protein|nr:hypothetical protein [Clostridia bacterium]MBR1433701.1 hypothetical protein [Bacteroidales bacterium]
MNSRTINRRLLALAFLLPVLLTGAGEIRAQIVVANPLEWAVLVEGNEIIDGQIKSEIEGQTQTAVLQGTIAAEFTQIKKWEGKYNAYLKSVDGYASSLKAATHLYNDGVRLFINLCDIRKAIANNPQGVAATFSMNNLYAETATELIAVYTTLKDAVATGGEGNMLTGAERSKTLWLIEDRLKAFNHKLSRLSLSLRYYTLSDVWYNATEGIIDRDYGDIARAAQSRWKRASRTY